MKIYQTPQDWLVDNPYTSGDLADLLGVTASSVRKWRRFGTEKLSKQNQTRLQVVSFIMQTISTSWNREGAIFWWYRPRYQLDGKRPIDVVDDSNYYDA